MASSDNKRVLISTIEPISGGVPTMTRFIAESLTARGFTPVLAHYEPYSRSPRLSVPSFKLGRARPDAERRITWDCYETHALGAWLPELEFTNYAPTADWCRVMDSCAAFVMVSGNVLAATPYLHTGRPFVAWVATGWEADRKERTAGFPAVRKLLDRCINAQFIRRLERDLLNKGEILALSQYTSEALEKIATKPIAGILPMPVDTAFFNPSPDHVVRGRIGFTGRLDDPRKNIDLLLEAIAHARQLGVELTALLTGGPASDDLTRRMQELGIENQVTVTPYVPREQLRQYLQTIDVFVVPSHQEGLCISALEAMACGCPVVATRCGGPQEFVIDNETGQLVDFDPKNMVSVLVGIVEDRSRRQLLSQGARRRVEQGYNRTHAEAIFWQHLYSTFPHLQKLADVSPATNQVMG